MFASRDQLAGSAGVVDIAFTDRHGGVSPPPFDSLDLSLTAVDRATEVTTNLARVAEAFGAAHLTLMHQVHGRDVVLVSDDGGGAASQPGSARVPRCDALVTDRPEVALCVRVGDCVPVVLADADRGVVGVAHAGRTGVAEGVVTATVGRMRERGAATICGWIGPHICGGCYEVPASLQAEVAGRVPAAFACTTWGTASLDLGAGVRAQLEDAGVPSRDLSVCTRESADFYSHRRDGTAAGRFGGLVVWREGRRA